MKLAPVFSSIRFRLSVLSSLVVFVLGSAAVISIFFVIRHGLRTDRVMGLVLTPGETVVRGGVRYIIPQLEMRQFQTVETVLRERILEDITGLILWGLVWLFVVSLVMGWFLAGRSLRPIGQIAAVAENIQAQDLTRRINLSGPDDELTRLAGTFDAMLDRLSGSFRVQQQFLASTSHDLRNPLAVIRSNLEVSLADSNATVEDWRETGEVVTRAAGKMSEMIDRLLEAARLEVGFSRFSELDIADLVASTAQAERALAEERDLQVQVRTQPALVSGDALALARILENLLDNAIAASPAGTLIEMECGESQGWAWMTVADRGPGIDPILLSGDSHGGGGLGLAIARHLAESHGGKLAAFPRDGGGTAMVVWIPSRKPAGEVPPETNPLG
ncbi:MAG: HAMP domain-containing sensor histidine kinase [bacterium]|nr:HAMP domain-containing histidine kinase [Acidimicrobiia bacterium]MCY4650144.1 HAMP domain-containing sensor histidine kinase [bacterium]